MFPLSCALHFNFRSLLSQKIYAHKIKSNTNCKSIGFVKFFFCTTLNQFINHSLILQLTYQQWKYQKWLFFPRISFHDTEKSRSVIFLLPYYIKYIKKQTNVEYVQFLFIFILGFYSVSTYHKLPQPVLAKKIYSSIPVKNITFQLGL